MKATSKEFRVVLMDSSLERETLRLASEAKLVATLQATHQIKAPVEMTYSDGSPIDGNVMDRIHRRLFATITRPA